MNEQEQMQFFYEIFDSSLPRLGPGDDASTRKALSMVLPVLLERKDIPDSLKLTILDLGCGNGAQTMQLAKYTDGSITSIDNHQPFLDELQRRAGAAGVSKKITVLQRDMRNPGLEKESFDLIWSEGALYIMGFREALKACHDLLSPKGMLAASEMSWLKPDPPQECRDYLAEVYPAIVDNEANLAAIRSFGYEISGYFVLPESAWRVSYYQPIEDRLRSLRGKYAADPGKMKMIESMQLEIDIYRKYSAYYGYVFYLMQKC